MKNIKLFEEFSTNDKMDEVRIPKGGFGFPSASTSDRFSDFGSDGQIVKTIGIMVRAENPDSIIDFSVKGNGKDYKEAATLALGTAWGVLMGDIDTAGQEIEMSDAISYLEKSQNSVGDWQRDVDTLSIRKSLPDGYFSDHGTDAKATFNYGYGKSNISQMRGRVSRLNFKNF